jgi:hypothetical protein
MIRVVTAVSAGAFVAALGNAPMQCGHGNPDPSLRREDSAGDALYALAQDFQQRGNDEARRQTLRFLVERYPSNRHAPSARAELEGTSEAKVDAGK